ncbi:hypothetical protein [uncultured Lacinutrix sp.]|uniref:hypothetical protein n=1 Tax=uncultured Lacinutrix sp. TaxID=574032 RepID=UPI002624CFC0|nr:hypothetical protein [uncultured Lacinutrix sp.]
MENTNAIKVIDKILNNLDKSGINTDTLIDDIKALRVYAIEEEVPLVVKVLRLAYEHIEEHEAFLLPIPQDEPLEQDEEELTEEDNDIADVSPVESLKYLIALTRNLNNKDNISDLKEYKELLLAY